MDLFDNLSKKISDTVNKAAEKTKQITDSTVNASKLRTLQKNAEKNINACYIQLGKAYYENSHDNCDNIYKEIIAAIDREKEIYNNAEKELDTLNGVKRCPECNKQLNDDSKFCDGCGVKLPEIIEEKLEPENINADENNESTDMEETKTAETEQTETAEVEAAVVSDKKICDNCGAEVPNWANFCTECGAKYK